MPDDSIVDTVASSKCEDLPEAVIIWEIILRLPPEDVLRCRAVRRSWRCATSSRDFLPAHHRRQPSVPLIYLGNDSLELGGRRLAALSCNTHSNLADDKIWPILLRSSGDGEEYLSLHGARDGLLLVSSTGIMKGARRSVLPGRCRYSLCNPATRQCAHLRQLLGQDCIDIVGLFQHHPSGEYRVLYAIGPSEDAHYYVLTLGSGQPRCILQPQAAEQHVIATGLLTRSSVDSPILCNGALHWVLLACYAAKHIVVFDTASEAFRSIRCPEHLGRIASLFEMTGTIGFCSAGGAVVEIWALKDYKAEVWEARRRIDMEPVLASPPVDFSRKRVFRVSDRELLIQITSRRALRYSVDGNILGNVECNDKDFCVWVITGHRHQASILPLPFLEKQEEEDGLNSELPFSLGQ